MDIKIIEKKLSKMDIFKFENIWFVIGYGNFTS